MRHEIALLALLVIERHRLLADAALLPRGSAMLIREKTRERAQQESAEATALRVRVGECLASQQLREKSLRQVLGVWLGVAFARRKA